MQILVERTVFKIGEGSLAVTLPKAWIKYNRLKPGDKVEITAGDKLTIRAINKQKLI